MQSPRQYEPIYVGLDDVPLEINDTYDYEAKREALFQAETKLELDRNGGEALPADLITPAHQTAVANLATHYLTRGSVSNDDVTLGDLGDDGDQRETHSTQYKDAYDEFIDAMSEISEGGQSGVYYGAAGSGGEAISVNSGRDSRRHRLGQIDPDGGRLPVVEKFVAGTDPYYE